MSQKDNQDHYKRGGRTGGPAGTLEGFKRKVGSSRSRLARDEEHVLPAEAPRAGRKAGGAKRAKAHPALDRLPRVTGTAGIGTRAHAAATASAGERGDAARGARAMAEPPSRSAYEDEPRPFPGEAASPRAGSGEEPFGIPASEEELGRAAGAAPDVPAWLWPALRPLRPAMRLIGGAARILDTPVRWTLETMQRLGRLAEAQPRKA